MKIQLTDVRVIELLSAMYNVTSAFVRGSSAIPCISLPSPLRMIESLGAQVTAQCVADLIQRDRGVLVRFDDKEMDCEAFMQKFPGCFERAYHAAQARELARRARWAWSLNCWGTCSPVLQGFAGLMLFAENWELLFVESFIPELLYFVSLPGSTYRLGREAMRTASR